MLIEHHEELRETLLNIINSNNTCETVQDAEDCSQALTYLPVMKEQKMLPDLIILPMRGKDQKETWAFISHVTANYPTVKLMTFFDYIGHGIIEDRKRFEEKFKRIERINKVNTILNLITYTLAIPLLIIMLLKKQLAN